MGMFNGLEHTAIFDNKMPPKKARSEKNQPKISFFTTSEKDNPWSEDETDTGTSTGPYVTVMRPTGAHIIF
jgi:hypothetical protein